MPTAPLIATKFHLPTASVDLVSRPQLFQRLEQGLSQPLTLVSAPPGFGKTMLVADWVHSRATDDLLKTGWLSLDEHDNEAGIFWRYFTAAIQRACPQLGEAAQAMLGAPTPPSYQTILGTLINELAALDTSVLIVLDDYHLIESQEIHENLAFFIDHLPSNAHLALLTREDPPLGLARRRARRQMVEIRATDLRFDMQETTGFLNITRKLALTPEQIATLEQRTEGWIAGLQMAALSLQGRDSQIFFESFSGDNRYIADYLIEEVLQRQSEEVRAFLLKTSILERMSASSCAALTGDASSARDTLDHLERANLFIVPLDNHREWYRYHHLFADLLRQRLKETYSPEDIANMYRAASTWHESQNDIHTAVRYAHHIPDHRRTLRLLEQNVVSFFARAELPQFFESARLLPQDVRKDSPFLCVSVAWAGLTANRRLEIAEWLNSAEYHFGISAESVLDDPSLDPARRAAMLEVLVVRLQLPNQRSTSEQRAHIFAIRDQLNALAPDQQCLLNPVFSLKPVIAFNLGLLAEQSGETSLAAQAYAECISLSRETHNSTLFHLALGNIANIQLARGQLHTSRQTHEHALAEARSVGVEVSPVISVSHAGLGTLHYEWNDLASAERHFHEGLLQARMWNHWESLLPIKLGLSRIKQRAGDIQSALSVLDELDSPPLEYISFSLEARIAYLRSRASDRDSASAWLAAKMTASRLEPSPVNESSLLDVARLMATLQRFDDSIALLQNMIRFSESGGRTYTLIQAKALLAKVMALKGNTSDAIDCLMEVLQLAMAEEYISTFVDEGETVRLLLSNSKSKVSSELRNYVDRVLIGFGAGENQASKPAAGSRSDLSEREKEILSLIAEGLSNQEIAARLVISMTTVKTHIGNIFNKLGVTSRTQALARSEGLGLLLRR